MGNILMVFPLAAVLWPVASFFTDTLNRSAGHSVSIITRVPVCPEVTGKTTSGGRPNATLLVGVFSKLVPSVVRRIQRLMPVFAVGFAANVATSSNRQIV